MSRRDHYYIGEDGKGRYPNLNVLQGDLDRLSELTGSYVADGDDDLGQATARIPDETQRREAEELLRRLSPVIGPQIDAISAALSGPRQRAALYLNHPRAAPERRPDGVFTPRTPGIPHGTTAVRRQDGHA